MLLTMPSNDDEFIPRTLQDLIGTFNVIPADAETDADPGYWKELLDCW